MGVRHALAPSAHAGSVDGVARAVVALHATDPATVVLSTLARAPHLTIADVERALYEARSVVRVLAMRRTLFAVPRDLARACVATSDGVARAERRKLMQLVEEAVAAGDITGDPAGQLEAATSVLEGILADGAPYTAQQLAERSELLATRLTVGRGTRYETRASLVSRLLTVLSAEGAVVRATPRGSWTAGQYRWTTPHAWLGERWESDDPASAAAEITTLWLHAFGPGTLEDLQWWSGWTKTRCVQSLAAVGAVEVQLDRGSRGYLLADDLAQVEETEPWVRLLPALDPTTMGWKHRDFYLSSRQSELFDRNGNAGPTIWADGKIVGAWAQSEDGRIHTRLLDVLDRDHRALLQRAVAELSAAVDGVRVQPRARALSPIERDLRDAATGGR